MLMQIFLKVLQNFFYGLGGNGNTGNNTMRGGAGNAIYLVASSSDVFIKDAGGGFERVKALVSYTTTPMLNLSSVSSPLPDFN